jgi:ubiquinone/menaquinone biosynthesis C-methylase UbiE
MPTDKSLFYYGRLYNMLLDPLIKPSRKAIVNQIPVGSTVLDIGCGTGLLCFELKKQKDCRVVGIDLSNRMLDYARNINPYGDIEFLHQDATSMNDLQDDSFDFVLIMNVIHELLPNEQLKMLQEAFRVAQSVILLDSNVPLPWNATGIVKRAIEVSFGFDHYPQFKTYITSGGILGILEKYEYSSGIREQSVFSQGCNQLVLVAR